MSSVFDMLFLFWLVVLCLSSSIYEIDVRVELLADDLLEADYDKPGFLSVGVDSFDQLFFINYQCPCPWCKIVIRTEHKINENKLKG